MNKCIQPWGVWGEELEFFIFCYPWNFCVLCFLGNEVWPVLQSSQLLGTCHISGIWTGGCPVVLFWSLQLTCSSSLIPLPTGTPLWLQCLLLSVENTADRWSCCKFLLDLWQREWSVKAIVTLGSTRLGCFWYLLSAALHCYLNTLPVH